MKNTFRKKVRIQKKNRTLRKKYSSTNSISNFEEQITVYFLEMLMMIKLFHWKTHSYATHKATDELYSKLNSNIDRSSLEKNRINLKQFKKLVIIIEYF